MRGGDHLWNCCGVECGRPAADLAKHTGGAGLQVKMARGVALRGTETAQS